MSIFSKTTIAAGLMLASCGAMAQTTTVVNGYVPRPDYQRYPTTGAPNGFVMPSVGLMQQGNYNRPNGTVSPTILPGMVGNPANRTTAVVPTPPEDPKVLETGRVKSDSTKEAVHQEPATSVAATSNAPAKRYSAGDVISGKAKIFDGHSLLIDGNAVRLDGADAPGAVQTCTSATGTAWRCGESAYRRLAELTIDRKVTCRVMEQVGTGAAAICSVTGVPDIAAILVREGLAVPNGHDAGRYGGAMNLARTGKIGMWSGSFTLPSKWRSANSGSTRYAVSR